MSTLPSPGLRARRVQYKLSKTEQRSKIEDEVGVTAFFGSFCLTCGEMCTGDSAYCSDACESVAASDAALHSGAYSPAWSATSVPPLISSRGPSNGSRRSGQSSAHSSSPASSVTNSPSIVSFPNGRLAMLAQGPLGGAIEEPTDLDLGEGVISDEVLRSFSFGHEIIPAHSVSGATITDSPWQHALYGTPGKTSMRSDSETALWTLPARQHDVDATVRAGAIVHPVAVQSLLHHWQPPHHDVPPHHDSVMAAASRVPLPPSPAVKALAVQPSVTPAAAAAARKESSRTLSDSSILLSSAVQKSQATQYSKRGPSGDARASLAKALGSRKLAPTRTASDFIVDHHNDKLARHVSAPTPQNKLVDASHGVLSHWQDRIKGMMLGASHTNQVKTITPSSEDDDEMTGVALGLGRIDSITSSTEDLRASCSSTELSLATQPNATASSPAPQPNRRSPGRAIFGKAQPMSEPSSDDLSLLRSRRRSDASPSVSRSRSRGRDRRRVPSMMPMVGPGAAGVIPEARGRSRFRVTAAVRSPSPQGRSRSTHGGRSAIGQPSRESSVDVLSLGGVGGLTMYYSSEDEGDVAEDEGDGVNHQRGRPRARNDRTRGRKPGGATSGRTAEYS